MDSTSLQVSSQSASRVSSLLRTEAVSSKCRSSVERGSLVLHGGRANTMNAEGIDPCLVYCLIMTLSACTLQCLYAYTTRTDIRRKYDLVEQPCDDCSTHIWYFELPFRCQNSVSFSCHFCALCQEYRELRKYPITVWPEPAVQGQALGYGHPLQQPQIQQIPDRASYAGTYVYQHSADGGASSVASYPMSYASYPTSPQYAPSAHSAQSSQQYPVPPPHQMRPPQPLVYENHQLPGQYGYGSTIPGVPALVYQLPRYPANTQQPPP